MTSAAEAQLGALYINARETIPQRHLLNELGHPQPPTPIQIDNSTALGVVTNIIQPKRTKAMDMRFHWLQNQKQFRTYWRAGTTNLADYVTKHHPALHHQAICHIYLTTPTKLLDLWHKAHNILKVATTLPTLPHTLVPLKTIPRNTWWVLSLQGCAILAKKQPKHPSCSPHTIKYVPTVCEYHVSTLSGP
eukprot:CCRYP_020991-RA/>CCRYP_020991-RA protein AED:0.43 eAED:0.43 QI:0/0/0/1/0/0/2/0/190